VYSTRGSIQVIVRVGGRSVESEEGFGYGYNVLGEAQCLTQEQGKRRQRQRQEGTSVIWVMLGLIAKK